MKPIRPLQTGPDSFVAGLRNILMLRRDPLGFLRTLAGEGDIAYRRMGSYRTYLLNEPDDVRELLVNHAKSSEKGPLLQRARHLLGKGLLTSHGEHHLRQRRLIQPLFQKQRLLGYAPAMVACTQRCHQRWGDGRTVDVHEEMLHLTLAVVGTALFGDDFERDIDKISQAMEHVAAALNMKEEAATLLLEKLGLPVPAQKRLHKAREILDQVIRQLTAKRQRQDGERKDLLSLLLNALDAEGEGGTMSLAQLLDECITLLLAGHETTASALTFTFYLLSQHPQAEGKLHAELSEVLGDRPPTAEDLPRLVYTEQVFAEALRLYPPAWMLGRFLTAPLRIGGRDFAAGTLLAVSPYTMQRDPRFFPEPLKFHPERFTPEAKAARPKFTYFPFGAGPRQCIGEGFAWMEGCLVLATIAQQYFLRLAPGQTVEPAALLTLRPKNGMRMVVHRRTASIR